MDALVGSKWRVHPVVKYPFLVLLFITIGYLTAHRGPLILGSILGVGAALWMLVLLYKYPQFNIYGLIVLAFFMAALGRYISHVVPWSLGIDVFLLVAPLALILKHWEYTDFRLANRSLVWLLVIWMGYIILQIFNPEAHSFMAWLYVMRGIALYPLLIAFLGLVLFNSKKDLERFLYLWLGLSVLGVLWAMKQDIIGVSEAESQWLAAGPYQTHILWGKLRKFSYYFDAGTFGAAMGHVSIVALILFLGPYARKRKYAFLAIGITSFYAMMLSGTRGALAVPIIGAVTYLIMVRRVKLLIIGAAILLGGFVFLKHTYIGSSYYEINRLRTALNPEDASLNVRLRNRAMLTEYLADKPFGGGVGTAGYWGRRFSPNTWLANFEPDGLYTQIRAETGIVGRVLYVGILLVILVKGMWIAMRLKTVEHQNLAMAIMAGYAGILMANYGNSVMTQFPIGVLVFLGLAFVFSMPYWNENGEVELPDGPTPVQGARKGTSGWG